MNEAIGGSINSQHSKGEALDLEIDGVSNLEVADWITDNCDYDQVILEFYNPADGLYNIVVGYMHHVKQI